MPCPNSARVAVPPASVALPIDTLEIQPRSLARLLMITLSFKSHLCHRNFYYERPPFNRAYRAMEIAILLDSRESLPRWASCLAKNGACVPALLTRFTSDPAGDAPVQLTPQFPALFTGHGFTGIIEAFFLPVMMV